MIEPGNTLGITIEHNCSFIDIEQMQNFKNKNTTSEVYLLDGQQLLKSFELNKIKYSSNNISQGVVIRFYEENLYKYTNKPKDNVVTLREYFK